MEPRRGAPFPTVTWRIAFAQSKPIILSSPLAENPAASMNERPELRGGKGGLNDWYGVKGHGVVGIVRFCADQFGAAALCTPALIVQHRELALVPYRVGRLHIARRV